jgi:hypothetical protein
MLGINIAEKVRSRFLPVTFLKPAFEPISLVQSAVQRGAGQEADAAHGRQVG